jgi:ribose/xylose/arabinose/galactoside ABC-type transport system permease subunit
MNDDNPSGQAVAVGRVPWQETLGRVGRGILLRGGAGIALLFLGLYLTFASPHFLTTSNLANILHQTAATAILAVGQTMVIIAAGIDLSVAATLGLSGSVAAVAMTRWGLNMWVGILLAIAAGAVVGCWNGTIITKGRIPDFIVTLGTWQVVRGVALLLTGGLPVPSHLTALELKGYLPERLIWLGSGNILGIPIPAIIALIVVAVGWVVLNHTRLGRADLAMGGNREAARVSGINVDRTRIAIYIFSGITAAIAGIVLTGRMNSANALMGEGMELDSIAAVIIGGTNLFGGEGTIQGTLIGALIMGVLHNGLNLTGVSAFWQRVVIGLVIIVVVVFDQWRRRRLGV